MRALSKKQNKHFQKRETECSNTSN